MRDRGLQRPAFSLRHARATLRRGTLAVDLGKQFIRWGKADILNPTDRFAPRDFLEVTDDEFLAVIGARGQYERGAHSIDVVWVPDVHAEPHAAARAPLGAVRRRRRSARPGSSIWAPAFPERSQYGARWNVRRLRASRLRSRISTGSITCRNTRRTPLSGQPLVALQRTYAPLRMAGADAAVPLRWFTVKGEAAVALHDQQRTPTMWSCTSFSSSGSRAS